ncbi:non-ribosomal peptide synthetase/MFS transporter [Streptomyces sp. YS415]|uniref:non-ribosomal peptide synthetase/MFS transporter n=1 Tax=Streptomyces sp. YS415 TaxID=2944806 RepID=UPI002020A47D|nr:non-ribosomal peptide synthetase/MFS transporter [Streptomyces sp. YS415]MCL7427064.1 amino acid adenylation domain-containing protein [Streptomyces sp. YS415]
MSIVDDRPQPEDRHDARGTSAARAELLARRLRRARTAAPALTVPRRPEGVEPPLSFAQERLWFMDRFVPDTTAYTVPQAVRLRGPLDPERLERALRRVVARHESLRMRFPSDADGRPRVEVTADGGVRLNVRTPPPETDPARREALVARWIDEEISRPFDLATGPVLHAALLRAAPSEHVLVLVHHHIVSDGWSSELFLRELLAACADGAPEPQAAAEPAVRYGDFASWQRERYRGEVRQADLDHWRARLAGVQPLDLPSDLPRPAEPTFRGAGQGIALDADLSRAVLDLGAAHGATPYMTLLAAYQALLGRWSGQDDFAVGSTVAGRTLPELEPLVGLFANVLALRADLSGDPDFVTLLGRVRDGFLADLAHQEMPFEQLVGELALPRDPSRTPIFQTAFTLLNYERAERGRAEHGRTEHGRTEHGRPAGPDVEELELEVDHQPFEIRATRFDLELYLRQTPDGLHGFFTYSTDLFSPATAARLPVLFERLLRQAVRHPDVPLSRLDLLDESERETVLSTWNDVRQEVPGPHTLHGRFEEHAARTPHQVCLVVDGPAGPDGQPRTEELTYRELDRRATALAGRLRGAGVGPGTVVAVCAERSAALVAALLGVLKAGGAYLPLDPDNPAERLAGLLADAAPPVLLAADAVHGRLPQPPEGTRVLSLDDPELWRPDPAAPPAPHITPDDPAYVIFTSGSTGRPKGVICTHRGIHNRLDWMQRAHPLHADDAVLQKTPTGFDVSVWELFWPLREGARLVMARPGGHRDGGYLRDAVRRHAVTTVHFVPSMLAVFLAEDGVERCTTLRRVICSGEELPADLARRFLDRFRACELHNLYGPTEASVDCTAWPCTRESLAGAHRVPIGRPVQNMRIYVLDRNRRPVPVGMPGELYIAGPGVALGYLNRPGLTAQRFVADPWGEPGARMYASGDLARHRPDGALEYLGRTDDQVKLHGLRIEPGEIEAALRALPGVGAAAVVVREDRPGDRRLVAYLVPEAPGGPAEGPGGSPQRGLADDVLEAGPDGMAADPASLRQSLRRTLPDSMLPSAYVVLDALPTGPNGKLDRRALPAPVRGAGAGGGAPATDAERAVAEVWARILDVPLPERDDDFFDLGGHSLLAIRIIAALRRALPEAAGVTLMDLFRQPTVRGLAAHLTTPEAERGPARVLHELTPTLPPGRTPELTVVAVPYGGGSAVVYRPLAEALPPGHALFALAGTGEEMGLQGRRTALPELVDAAVAEILERVHGPLVLYGHCGVGGALVIALALALEAAGRPVQAVYAGGIFPFARPRGPVVRMLDRLERFGSDRRYRDWLISIGLSMDDVEPAQARRMVRDMRADNRDAEEYFTALLQDRVEPLSAPVISVVGERDDITLYHEERFREWHFVTNASALVVLDEAGHYFLSFRAPELADIITSVHPALTAPTDAGPQQAESGTPRPTTAPRPGSKTWRLADVSHGEVPVPGGGPGEEGESGPGKGTPSLTPGTRRRRDRRPPEPAMPRFLAVAAGQLVSMAGTSMTEFALPLWVFLGSGSLLQLGLLSSLALVPGLLVAPLAGAVADRFSRRRVMIAADVAALLIQGLMLTLLLAGALTDAALYPLMTLLSVALTFQRISWASAVPQLAPKQYLGHANGLVQAGAGTVQFAVPLLATAVLATVGLRGILIIDVCTYAVAIAVTASLRFPARLGWRRRESVGEEIRAGFRLAMSTPGFRAMLLFFAVTNLLLGPLLILFQPLVLGFTGLGDVARVSLAGGVGIAAGGALMAFWGGPKQRRMTGVLLAFLVLAACCAVTGLRPSLPLVAAGVFGMFAGLTVMNAIYATIIQVKVPARFHGRIFAVNTVFAWCTMPVGFLLLGPGTAALLEPAMEPDGTLAGTAGRILGTGEGRGLGLMYVLFGLALVLVVLCARRIPALARFDAEVPDARPDDLVGLQSLHARRLPDPSPDGPSKADGSQAPDGHDAQPLSASAPPTGS